MFESLLTDTTGVSISMTGVLISIVVALIAGGLISFTYMKTYPKGGYSQNFAMTMIMLPVVVAIIIMLIGSDVARAFSLAGAFSIIRFRSAPGEPKDIAYVLFAMAAGLSVGVGVYAYALFFTAILCLTMYGLSKTHLGKTGSDKKQLIITVPEDLEYEEALKDVFEKFTSYYALKKVKTTALGSLYQLTYDVAMKGTSGEKAFIDELRCRNGNLNINLMLSPDSGE
ncbi:MAG: hypothetical protein PWQ12_2163 [Clostridiales bacterium]|jgi:hypothetical protein|nr:hypothetical protein [Clostridiales bacterium]